MSLNREICPTPENCAVNKRICLEIAKLNAGHRTQIEANSLREWPLVHGLAPISTCHVRRLIGCQTLCFGHRQTDRDWPPPCGDDGRTSQEGCSHAPVRAVLGPLIEESVEDVPSARLCDIAATSDRRRRRITLARRCGRHPSRPAATTLRRRTLERRLDPAPDAAYASGTRRLVPAELRPRDPGVDAPAAVECRAPI
jgi:hypothetical protein